MPGACGAGDCTGLGVVLLLCSSCTRLSTTLASSLPGVADAEAQGGCSGRSQLLHSSFCHRLDLVQVGVVFLEMRVVVEEQLQNAKERSQLPWVPGGERQRSGSSASASEKANTGVLRTFWGILELRCFG